VLAGTAALEQHRPFQDHQQLMLVAVEVVELIMVVDRAGLGGLEVVALVRKPEMQLLEP
jgi:hypothetical protein